MSLNPGLIYFPFTKIPLDKCQAIKIVNPGNSLTPHNLYYGKISTLTGLGTLYSQPLLQIESPRLNLNKGFLILHVEKNGNIDANIWTLHTIFMNINYVHVIIVKEEGINLNESREQYVGRFRRKERKGEMFYLCYNLKKILTVKRLDLS